MFWGEGRSIFQRKAQYLLAGGGHCLSALCVVWTSYARGGSYAIHFFVLERYMYLSFLLLSYGGGRGERGEFITIVDCYVVNLRGNISYVFECGGG